MFCHGYPVRRILAQRSLAQRYEDGRYRVSKIDTQAKIVFCYRDEREVEFPFSFFKGYDDQLLLKDLIARNGREAGFGYLDHNLVKGVGGQVEFGSTESLP